MQTEFKFEHETPMSLPPLYRYWRKVIDITSGLCGTIALLIILPILALLIYLDSPGPIFYSQERLGYRGKKFYMLKFRSMCPNTEDVGDGAWTAKDDLRVTRVGRFLRATHLDELPQAFNILRGEMSLIGPRPDLEKNAAELEKVNPLYRQRLSVQPGLTGWTQVKFGYGTTYMDELAKLPYDLYYIKHQSFMLDIDIILKTIVEVVSCHGQ